jgi:hypothetical protein
MQCRRLFSFLNQGPQVVQIPGPPVHAVYYDGVPVSTKRTSSVSWGREVSQPGTLPVNILSSTLPSSCRCSFCSRATTRTYPLR